MPMDHLLGGLKESVQPWIATVEAILLHTHAQDRWKASLGCLRKVSNQCLSHDVWSQWPLQTLASCQEGD